MPVSDEPRLHCAELSQLLRNADRAALLVPQRLLRRIIKHDRQLTGLGLQVPHHKSYVIDREALLALATRTELGAPDDGELPPTLLLMARPEPEELALPREQVLLRYWRLLFHCAVHRALRNRIAEQRLSPAVVRERIHRIGAAEFTEIRTVLRQEKLLLPPRDDRTVYEEFAAHYLELSFFAATLLPSYFPAIEHFSGIDAILAEDVDAVTLFAATRPAGAPDPVFPVDVPAGAEEPEFGPADDETPLHTASAEQFHALLASAARAATAGNMVRAAICRAQAARWVPPESADALREQTPTELDHLTDRLHAALHLSAAAVTAWRRALQGLLPIAARGIWPAEARLLYDLQKVCEANERPVSAPDFIGWVRSGFRRPLEQPLPDQPLVLTLKHLRSVADRLPSLRVTESQRHALASLLRHALHAAEQRLRDRFRPLVSDALSTAGVHSQNFPECVAHDKLVEELLDRVTERGFLNMPDMRDALSRNQLKLPDLAGPDKLLSGHPRLILLFALLVKDVTGPNEILGGDLLLRADRELAGRAAGVYNRSEVYLRWLQRGSALAFGTRVGRWFTLFLALPFGGAYASVVFVQEMLHLVHVPHHLRQTSLIITVGVLGIFYLLLLHVPAFRELTGRCLRAVGEGIHRCLIDLPMGIVHLPLVRWIRESRPYLLFVRYVLKPLPAGVLAWAALHFSGVSAGGAVLGGVVVFLIACLLINSRLGRDLEEILSDWAVRRWDYYRDLLPGIFRLVTDVFKRSLEALDRFLYSVDEWLRFRGGEGRWTRTIKLVLGLAWSVVAYVIRLYVNVFIEPTVNPLKHFPAVTVAAKLLVPFWIPLTMFFGAPLQPLGEVAVVFLGTIILHSLPGAAGFLVWELQANWRLYRANRPCNLQPVVVGSHGETLLRLLMPGFHSGTLPKLYAKLRRAERRALRSNKWRAPRRLRAALHHVEESIRHFTERELLAFINGSNGWTADPIRLAVVETGSNRIRLELACPTLDERNLELKFEEQSGWLLAHVSRPGWLPKISPGQAAVLTTALAGFYPKCAIDLVREQVDASLQPMCPPYDIADEGLVVWPGQGYEAEVVYDLREGPLLHPRVVIGEPPVEMPVLDAEQVLFHSRVVSWPAWVAAWDHDQAGAGIPEPLLPGMPLLPVVRKAP